MVLLILVCTFLAQFEASCWLSTSYLTDFFYIMLRTRGNTIQKLMAHIDMTNKMSIGSSSGWTVFTVR